MAMRCIVQVMPLGSAVIIGRLTPPRPALQMKRKDHALEGDDAGECDGKSAADMASEKT